MRNVFREACRMDGIVVLMASVRDRRAMETEFKGKIDKLKKVGDPLALAEIKMLEQLWKSWE